MKIESPKPVVARVNGAARAGGLGLIAACDLAVGLASATFGFSEVRIGVAPASVLVRRMTRKWGSCSTSGRVSFAADLLAQPAEFRKECIVHELLHLKVPHHGKLFKSLLKAYLAQGAGA